MRDVFICHVEEDGDLAFELAEGLERAGYSTWFYERDSFPGPIHLKQTSAAIEEAQAFLLLISSRSVESIQVATEVFHAHEAGKRYVPILCDLSYAEFVARQPEWRVCLGAHASIRVPPQGMSLVVPRVIRGLELMGVLPRESPLREQGHAQSVSSVSVADGAVHGDSDELPEADAYVEAADESSVTIEPPATEHPPSSQGVETESPALATVFAPVAGWLTTRRRSWKIPIALAVMAAVAVGSALVLPRLSAWINSLQIDREADHSGELKRPTPVGFVRIDPGVFQMGSPTSEGVGSGETQHWVQITKPFLLGETEVTQAEYQAVMGTNPSHFQGPQRPVERVTWFDAVNYCNALTDRAPGLTRAYTVSGSTVTWNRAANGYRLPTESEWEYACRAGTTTRYWSGERESDLEPAAWYGANSWGQTNDVKGKQANAWGLYDMHGNVWEWCWDWDGTYPAGSQGSPAVDPSGSASQSYRVLRGGSWLNGASYLRCASRVCNYPSDKNYINGFRVARTIAP